MEYPQKQDATWIKLSAALGTISGIWMKIFKAFRRAEWEKEQRKGCSPIRSRSAEHSVIPIVFPDSTRHSTRTGQVTDILKQWNDNTRNTFTLELCYPELSFSSAMLPVLYPHCSLTNLERQARCQDSLQGDGPHNWCIPHQSHAPHISLRIPHRDGHLDPWSRGELSLKKGTTHEELQVDIWCHILKWCHILNIPLTFVPSGAAILFDPSM